MNKNQVFNINKSNKEKISNILARTSPQCVIVREYIHPIPSQETHKQTQILKTRAKKERNQ